MFKIRHRVTWNDERIRSLADKEFYDVEGNFQLLINQQSYGYCYEPSILDEYETGDWLFQWFDSFLQAMTYMNNGITRVYVKDIESYDVWIELTKISDDLAINVVRYVPRSGMSDVYTDELDIDCHDWCLPEVVSYDEFCCEVLFKAKELADHILKINPSLKNAGYIKRIIDFCC